MKLAKNNPRTITDRQLADLGNWLEELGDLSGIVHDLNSDEVVGGNQRVKALNLLNVEPTITERFDPPTRQGTVATGYFEKHGDRYAYRAVRWDRETFRKANVVANKAGGEFDFELLGNWAEQDELVEWGFDVSELEGLFEDVSQGHEETEHISSYCATVPDLIFDSDNDFGIPLLDNNLQADELALPLTRWGEIGRTKKMKGTYHFYTDDYKFNTLWKDPRNLTKSECTAIIEPNCSTNDDMPVAVGLWGIYRKRWLARYAQTFGIKVWVDLNVVEKFIKYNLFGIPQGWRTFATRGLDKYIDFIEKDYAIAREIAAPKGPRFLVYGGGQKVRNLCQSRGFDWYPENIHVKEGRMEGYNYG